MMKLFLLICVSLLLNHYGYSTMHDSISNKFQTFISMKELIEFADTSNSNMRIAEYSISNYSMEINGNEYNEGDSINTWLMDNPILDTLYNSELGRLYCDTVEGGLIYYKVYDVAHANYIRFSCVMSTEREVRDLEFSRISTGLANHKTWNDLVPELTEQHVYYPHNCSSGWVLEAKVDQPIIDSIHKVGIGDIFIIDYVTQNTVYYYIVYKTDQTRTSELKQIMALFVPND